MSVLVAIDVFLSAEERELIETAARAQRTDLRDFMRREAIVAAELEMMDNRVVTIPAADWDRFEEWMNSPPKDVPAMRKLSARKPVWDDNNSSDD